jgi:hypothetical protein
MILEERKHSPGQKRGTTYGKPGDEWNRYNHTKGAPESPRSSPRPGGVPLVPTHGSRTGRVGRWEQVNLIDGNDGKNPDKPPRAATRPTTKTEDQSHQGMEDSPTPRRAVDASKWSCTLTAPAEVAIDKAPAAHLCYRIPHHLHACRERLTECIDCRRTR